MDIPAEKAESIVYSGLIAQNVEKAAKKINYNFSGVVAPQSDKDHYSIRYAEFVVPLIKATQEQQKELDSKTEEIEYLKKEMAALKEMVKKLSKNNPTSISEIQSNSSLIKCSPNPSSGIIDLNITNTNGEMVKTMVFDLKGNILYQSSGNENNFQREIDLSKRANGSYVIKTFIGNKVFQNKVLIQK